MFTFYCRKKKNAIYCCPYFCGGEYIDTIISFTCFFVMLRKQQITLYTKPVKSADTSTTSRFCYYAIDLVTGLKKKSFNK